MILRGTREGKTRKPMQSSDMPVVWMNCTTNVVQIVHVALEFIYMSFPAGIPSGEHPLVSRRVTMSSFL